MIDLKFNRVAYMADECTHQEYYGQFVGPQLKLFVSRHIGIENILNSKDPNFNDIPLAKWARMEAYVRGYCGSDIADSNASASGGWLSVSLFDCVCVAKEAARQLREQGE